VNSDMSTKRYVLQFFNHNIFFLFLYKFNHTWFILLIKKKRSIIDVIFNINIYKYVYWCYNNSWSFCKNTISILFSLYSVVDQLSVDYVVFIYWVTHTFTYAYNLLLRPSVIINQYFNLCINNRNNISEQRWYDNCMLTVTKYFIEISISTVSPTIRYYNYFIIQIWLLYMMILRFIINMLLNYYWFFVQSSISFKIQTYFLHKFNSIQIVWKKLK
jgi:hypothetical protein